jgi:hypothetical protein
MPRKKIKEEIRKPDILLKTIDYIFVFVQTNLRVCIIALAVICVAGLSAYGYAAYQGRMDARAQSQLFQGIKSFEEFNMTGKKEDLDKAIEIFQKLINQKQGKASKVARLYMGTVYAIKGQTEEARKALSELSKDAPPVLAMLSTKTLRSLEKP